MIDRNTSYWKSSRNGKLPRNLLKRKYLQSASSSEFKIPMLYKCERGTFRMYTYDKNSWRPVKTVVGFVWWSLVNDLTELVTVREACDGGRMTVIFVVHHYDLGYKTEWDCRARC